RAGYRGTGRGAPRLALGLPGRGGTHRTGGGPDAAGPVSSERGGSGRSSSGRGGEQPRGRARADVSPPRGRTPRGGGRARAARSAVGDLRPGAGVGSVHRRRGAPPAPPRPRTAPAPRP